ncbi:CrcB-like protein-domain-containing protein [Tirmania nivea]|nr:CrcB-like protein-domain-containing protein [Tirmania nivea]
MAESPNIRSGIDDTEALPPIKNLVIEAQIPHLEDATPGTQDMPAVSPATVEGPEIAAGIHEIKAPPPVRDSLDEARTPPLEDVPKIPQEHIVLAVSAQEKALSLFKVNCWLVFFSIWGTLARLGFIAFTSYTGAPLNGGSSAGSGVIWANFVGCVIMGFLIEDLWLFSLARVSKERKQKQDSNRGTIINDPEANEANSPLSISSTKAPTVDKSTIPLYIGLTSGFCGSFTSFSSYMLQSFLYLSNSPLAYTHPEKGYSILSFLAYIVLTLALSVSGLQFGAHLAEFTQSYTLSIPSGAIRFFDKMVPLLAIGIWIGSIAVAVVIKQWRGKALFACVFSPLGALARFWVSKLLNPRIKGFPLGTFAVNIFGSALLAGVVAGQYSHGWTGTAGRIVWCQLLSGVGNGFCGCLTTVSTWVVELRGLRRYNAYPYAIATIITGMVMMIAILGSYVWSHDELIAANGAC